MSWLHPELCSGFPETSKPVDVHRSAVTWHLQRLMCFCCCARWHRNNRPRAVAEPHETAFSPTVSLSPNLFLLWIFYPEMAKVYGEYLAHAWAAITRSCVKARRSKNRIKNIYQCLKKQRARFLFFLPGFSWIYKLLSKFFGSTWRKSHEKIVKQKQNKKCKTSNDLNTVNLTLQFLKL